MLFARLDARIPQLQRHEIVVEFAPDVEDRVGFRRLPIELYSAIALDGNLFSSRDALRRLGASP